MRRTALGFLLLAATVVASAQELTIFDLDDFVDPRTLGAAVTSRGTFSCPCSDLLITRAMMGWNSDYMNVTVPTQLDVGFAHVATSYYRGAWQFNAKFTGLRDVHRPAISTTPPSSRAMPRESAAFQIGFYRAAGSADRPHVHRTQFTWRMSHYSEPRYVIRNDRFAIEQAQLIRHEFGVEWDVPAPRGTLGSLVLTSVAGEHPTLENAKEQTRLAYVHRSRQYEFGPVLFDATIAAGVLGRGLNFGDLRRITIKPAARLAVPLGRTGINLNVRYAPTFQRRTRFYDDGSGIAGATSGGESKYIWERSPELAIFIDRAILRRTRIRAANAGPL